MKNFLAALWTESLKVRKAKVVWLTAGAFTIAPFMAGFFMFILKDPELAKSSGLLGDQAQLAGEANWSSYLSLHAQMIAVGGIFVFGFITSWIFGREFADQTVKDLLSLPFSRTVIVTAKFAIAFLTSFILTAYILVIGFLIGWLIRLPGWSIDMVSHELFITFGVTLLTIPLSTSVAFFASWSKGYLAPLGFVIISLVLSQIVAAIGYGTYFPWSIPALYGGIIDGEHLLNWCSLLILIVTGLIGIVGTICWWRYADHD